MKKYKKDFLLFFICLFFFNTKLFDLKAEINGLNNQKVNVFSKEDQLDKNQGQENIYINSFKSFLMGIGLSNTESNAAYKSLAAVLPLEILKDRGNIILPINFETEKIFAININEYDSIILKKENNKFVPFITNAQQASRLISYPKDLDANQENIIRINDDLIDNNKKLFTKNIIFKKGDSLDNKLNELNIGKKELKKIKKLISASINPKKIKIGTALLAYVKEKRVVAISMPLKKNNILLIYKINRDYESKTVNAVNFKNIISKMSSDNENLITRIDLFKNDNYRVMKNVLKKGESIYELLKKYNVSAQVINNFISAVKPYYALDQIKAGKKLEVIFDINDHLQGVSYKIDKTTKLQIALVDNSFRVFFYKKPYKIKNHLSEITISSNFYNDSEVYGLPRSIFFELVKILSFSLDFQRDIRKNTIFLVLYEKLYDYQNNLITTGKILYTKVLLKNNSIEMYLFDNNDKELEFYDNEGKSIRKTLMKTPIDGARLSSGFGKRRHPILGYNKMHKGIDFAAKSGTPIYAAGDGIIERANFYGAYGRYIRIKHNSQYKTAYAHLSKFARGVKRNFKVKQGQIIGYVGTSGRSTGPHLHYEVIFNEKQINPNKLKMPEVRVLNENEILDFNKQKENIKKILLNIMN